MGCRAMTKSTLNVHAGHDDYHCIDDTGFFQLFGKSAQEVCDLNIISHRIAELALTPGICAQDGFLTTHLIESLMLPERELIAEFLGRPDDIIDTPTPAQRISIRPAPPPHSGTVDGRQSGHDRHRAEPGRVHAERRRAAAFFLRPHRRRSPTKRWTISLNSPAAATSVSRPIAPKTPTI